MKIVTAVAYRDSIFIFYEDGQIWEMFWDSFGGGPKFRMLPPFIRPL